MEHSFGRVRCLRSSRAVGSSPFLFLARSHWPRPKGRGASSVVSDECWVCGFFHSATYAFLGKKEVGHEVYPGISIVVQSFAHFEHFTFAPLYLPNGSRYLRGTKYKVFQRTLPRINPVATAFFLNYFFFFCFVNYRCELNGDLFYVTSSLDILHIIFLYILLLRNKFLKIWNEY